MVNELPVERLRKECDPTLMRCETTEELTPLKGSSVRRGLLEPSGLAVVE